MSKCGREQNPAWPEMKSFVTIFNCLRVENCLSCWIIVTPYQALYPLQLFNGSVRKGGFGFLMRPRELAVSELIGTGKSCQKALRRSVPSLGLLQLRVLLSHGISTRREL
jgi:hypothetical protein